jgi:hypothetical protein
MEEIGKIKPESIMVGSNVTITTTIIATCWVRAMVETIKPKLRAVIIYKVESLYNQEVNFVS